MSSLINILFGSSTGLIYGLSFVIHQRRVFGIALSQRIRNSSYLFSLLRTGILFLFGYYLLHLSAIDSILVVVSFVMAFWLVVLNKKAFFHA